MADVYDIIWDPAGRTCVVRHCNVRPHYEVHAERVIMASCRGYSAAVQDAQHMTLDMSSRIVAY